jgi:hypothetical protein
VALESLILPDPILFSRAILETRTYFPLHFCKQTGLFLLFIYVCIIRILCFFLCAGTREAYSLVRRRIRDVNVVFILPRTRRTALSREHISAPTFLTHHRKSEHFPTGLTLMPIANHLANYLACVSFPYEKLRSDTNFRPDRGGGAAATHPTWTARFELEKNKFNFPEGSSVIPD